MTLKVELPACVGAAIRSVGGGGGSLATVICWVATCDSLSAASVAVSVRMCVPSESSVVGRMSVCCPVASGQGWTKVKLHGAL